MVTPHQSKTHNAATRWVAHLPVCFTVPYLKGRPTHFEHKLENHVTSTVTVSPTSSPMEAMPDTAVVVKTQKTSGQ